MEKAFFTLNQFLNDATIKNLFNVKINSQLISLYNAILISFDC